MDLASPLYFFRVFDSFFRSPRLGQGVSGTTLCRALFTERPPIFHAPRYVSSLPDHNLRSYFWFLVAEAGFEPAQSFLYQID